MTQKKTKNKEKKVPPVIKAKDQPITVATADYPYAKWKFEKFNPVQSRIMDFYDKDTNGLIAASTSAGKTVVAEMFMSQEVRKRGGKAMFLAPLRALAREKITDWTDKNYHFADQKISICTGDYRLTKERAKELNDANIIIMTSEMLNHRSRNNKSEQNDFLKQVGTLIIDESHLLTVPGRGDHLEVGLMKFTEINPKARLVLLSATMPNVEEIADWISYSLTKRNTFMLRSDYRPVPLTVHYESYYDTGRYDQVEEEKVNKALEIVEWYPDDKFLIFAHTKRTGELMKQSLKSIGVEAQFHNADLEGKKREEVEDRFKNDPKLRVIVATSTLAWGCYAKGSLVLMGDSKIAKIENIKVGDTVLSMSPEGFVPKKVLKTGYKFPKKALEITLSSGEQAIISGEHKFFATTKRRFPDYVQADCLEVGDFIAVPPGVDMEDVSALQADDLGYLFGYVMGDGSKTRSGFFANGEEKNVLDISFGKDESVHCEYIRKLFKDILKYELSPARPDQNGVLHLVTKAREVVEVFRVLKPGRHKDSLSLFNLPSSDPSFLKGVLQGLFDSDGGFSWHGNDNVSIEFTTISKSLAQEVQQLLLLFGVRATCGKKKVVDSVINGRLQEPRREFVYRVRIYTKNVLSFVKNVGFRINSKYLYGDYVSNLIPLDKKEVDLIPARSLLIEHADKNSVSPQVMMKSIKSDLWNSLNKQDLTREKCLQIIDKFPIHSTLVDLINSEVRFSKIKSITEVPVCEMVDIEIEDLHNYVGCGMISHNCNLPARRVIILGVNRGIGEVETHDILQMVGRSGRLGIDPMGDAYILVPESDDAKYRQKFSKPNRIESQLLQMVGDKYKVLAFHLVSEIHHGTVSTTDDVIAWYKRSLAYFQNKSLDESIVSQTLNLLRKCSAVWEEDGNWTCRPIGKVSSMFYFSPFDVSDLYFNFKNLFEDNKEDNDYFISIALGNIDGQRTNIVSRIEKQEMESYATRVRNVMPGKFFTDASLKAGFCYYNLLNGVNSQACSATQRSLQFDFNRLSQVLQALDSYGGNWQQQGFFKTLEGRIVNGVPAHLVDLCRLANVGKARASKLYAAGFKTAESIADMDLDNFKKIVNMKSDAAKDIMDSAKKFSLL